MPRTIAIEYEGKPYSVRLSGAMIACHKCGKPTPAELIDGKPEAGEDLESADFTRLECRECYGPNWAPL